MAVVHVATWDDFVSEIKKASTTEVIVDADLDANNWKSSTIEMWNNSNMTITGNDHTIRNIIYTHNGAVFRAMGSNVTFNKLSFVNVMTTMTADYAFFDAYNQVDLNLVDCKFQGRFYNFGYRRVKATRCTFTFEDGLADFMWTNGSDATLDYCYVDFKTQTANGTNLISGEATNNNAIHNCYFKGTINNSGGQFTSRRTYSSVFNLYINTGANNARITDRAQSICLYNTDRFPNAVQKDNMVGLSDSDLKNADAVIATGFPLVR